jgi:hypothetical protein
VNMTDARRWAKTARTIEPRATAAGPVGDRYRMFRTLSATAAGS